MTTARPRAGHWDARPWPAGHPLTRLRARDVMSPDPLTVPPGATVGDALGLLRSAGVRHLPVTDQGRFLGLVDDRLLAFALLATGWRDALGQRVEEVMLHYVAQVPPDAALHRVASLLRTSRCDAVVVIDGQDLLLGIITAVDVVAAVADDSEVPDSEASDSGDAGSAGTGTRAEPAQRT